MKLVLSLVFFFTTSAMWAQLRTDTLNIPLAAGAEPEVFMAYQIVEDSLPATFEDSLLVIAREYLGTAYRFGSQSEMALDCSGFVCQVYSRMGFEFPHSSALMSKIGSSVKKEELQAGDLLFFKGRSTKSKRVGHVSIVSKVDSDGTVYMIHASTHAGVIEESVFDKAYYNRRYLLAKRVVPKV